MIVVNLVVLTWIHTLPSKENYSIHPIIIAKASVCLLGGELLRPAATHSNRQATLVLSVLQSLPGFFAGSGILSLPCKPKSQDLSEPPRRLNDFQDFSLQKYH